MAKSALEPNAELFKFGMKVTEWDFHSLIEYIGDFGISRALLLSSMFLALCFTLARMVPDFWLFSLTWIAGTMPIWLPVALLIAMWKTWKIYIFSLGYYKTKFILMEMKVPREITRSPRAMELALTALWASSGETTFIRRHWRGQVRPYYALELASFGGDVHMYIWCAEGDKNVFESALYAYYPEVELHEVEDYAQKFVHDPSKYSYFCTDHVLWPRNDAYPIKTYVDFELDKDPKEEFRVDPIAQVMESLSNLKPQEQAWVQIHITMSKDHRRKPGTLFGVEDRFAGMIKDEVEEIRKKAMDVPGKGGTEQGRFPHPTWSQTEQIRAMERHLGKLPFNVGFRAVYIAEKAYFNGGSYNGIRWIWRPMGLPGYLNMLRPKNWTNTMDYPWQDFGGFRAELLVRRFLDAYRRRSYFYPPWVSDHYMMSPEAIATLWHPPSSAVAAPGLQRIPATKAEPPSNLPR